MGKVDKCEEEQWGVLLLGVAGDIMAEWKQGGGQRGMIEWVFLIPWFQQWSDLSPHGSAWGNPVGVIDRASAFHATSILHATTTFLDLMYIN